jgi:Cu2+-exporting ATPase
MSTVAAVAHSSPLRREQTLDASAALSGFVEEDAGLKTLRLLVQGVHCANCIRKIENGLAADPNVTQARINLSLRKLTVSWTGGYEYAGRIAEAVDALGYDVAPFEPGQLTKADNAAGRELLRSLAIAAFASSNVMMLSWAVWAGQSQDMPLGTQELFQWLSAIVAIPAIAFAGKPFFRSAFQAIRAGRTNVDVPIVAGLTLTTAISFVELLHHGSDVYFDSAAMLLFVLLIGRYLDSRVRARARNAIEELLMMKAQTACVRHQDGRIEVMQAASVMPGMTLIVRAGERVPADGEVTEGHSELDVAIVTGESLPVSVGPGHTVLAGSLNGGGLLYIRASRAVDTSHLAEILRLVEQAEFRRGPSARLADRVARIWTPAVHGIALLTLLGWWVVGGVSVPTALLYAVSVLIIACPCAIGLAVPAVQVVTIGALLKHGILLRSGDALERLANIDRVAFDKTGTLSHGHLQVVGYPDDESAIKTAIALAVTSNHPLARAIVDRFGPAEPAVGVKEIPGRGIEAPGEGGPVRLGNAGFCGVDGDPLSDTPEVWLSRPGQRPVRFTFADTQRPEAASVVTYFRRHGFAPVLLSGDKAALTRRFAASVGISDVHADILPAGKADKLNAWRREGRCVLMIGDGLNDAPALANAYVSASFGHGAAISQGTADIILPSEKLDAIILTHRTAKRASGIIRQNLGLAAIYNAGLIPVAVLGYATPLLAALAMSASSLAVTLNALRSRPRRRDYR